MTKIADLPRNEVGITAALDELQQAFGDNLLTGQAIREQHGHTTTWIDTQAPDAVVMARSTEEVAQAVRICAAHRLPVIPFGTGTSLEGHVNAPAGGVCIDVMQMDRVLEVNAGDLDCRVQPGVTREALNEDLRATGLFFPIDPGANASLGGMAATRASGTTAVRYGTMRNNVLGMQVVLADGRVIRTGSRARKSSAGYDMTGLFVGSEGTLGLITELTLRLYGQPEATAAAVCAFPRIEDAVETVIDTIQLGIPMARIEFIDTETVQAVNAYSGTTLPPMPHLMVEFHGSDAGAKEQAETFGEIVADHGGTGFEWATRPEDRKALWHMRHTAYWAILAARPGARAIVTDICVPISRLAEAVNATRSDLEAAGVDGPILGHVGDGNFHAILMFDPEDDAAHEAVMAASERLVALALSLGGTATGEHGIGVGKLGYMEREHGTDAWAMMGAVKRALDPQNIMNPGKMVPQGNG